MAIKFATKEFYLFLTRKSKYLASGWTNFVNDLFENVLPQCTIKHCSHYVRKDDMHSPTSPLVRINAMCHFESNLLKCSNVYLMLDNF